MMKNIRVLAAVLMLALPGCGGAASGTVTPDIGSPTPREASLAGSPTNGGTVEQTAQAYIAAWEAEDGAAMEHLLTAEARSAWVLGGGMSKRLHDKRQAYGSPVRGKGRVLALEEHGGTATADVGVVYSCPGSCYRYDLPDWPPPGSAASADRLTLQRQADGSWLISYLDGSSYLDDQVKATQVVLQGATHTAAAANWQKTKTAMPRQTMLPTRTPAKR